MFSTLQFNGLFLNYICIIAFQAQQDFKINKEQFIYTGLEH